MGLITENNPENVLDTFFVLPPMSVTTVPAVKSLAVNSPTVFPSSFQDSASLLDNLLKKSVRLLSISSNIVPSIELLSPPKKLFTLLLISCQP